MKRCTRCFAPIVDRGLDVHDVCPIGPPYPDPFWDRPDQRYADVEGAPMTFRQYTWAFDDERYKRVADTVCDDGWRVSTVWLGISVLRLYETMLFGPERTYGPWGAASRAEAEAVHEVVVAIAQDATRRALLTELQE